MSHQTLCVTVSCRSIDDLRRQRDEAAAIADLVELRLDALERPEVAPALAGRRGPVLVTCRPRWEGGGFDGPETVRLGLLQEAVRLGADYVDVEWAAAHQEILALRGGRGIVLSVHDFEGVPADLRRRYEAMRATGAEVVKLAVLAASLRDTVILQEIGREAVAAGQRAALVAMGPCGVATRILPSRFGSCWSYAGEGVAPGQVAAGRLLEEFRFREVGEATRLFGLAGRPVAHSVSPLMHNAAFRQLGLDAVYVPFEAADAADFLEWAARLGVEGASVTAPLKTGVFEAVASRDASSTQTGAINTLRRRQGRWEGRNTDVAGFLAPLEGLALGGCRAAVLGSGGAARAAVVALGSRGAHVGVYGRDAGRVGQVAALAGGEAHTGVPPRGSWDLLVNATPVGTFPDVDETPLPAGRLSAGLVYDLVYNPPRTRLLREAEQAGCRTIGGLEMLVAQAALQFRWWTDREAPADLMRDRAAWRLAQTTGAE